MIGMEHGNSIKGVEGEEAVIAAYAEADNLSQWREYLVPHCFHQKRLTRMARGCCDFGVRLVVGWTFLSVHIAGAVGLRRRTGMSILHRNELLTSCHSV